MLLTQPEVALNASRILSKLSLNPACQEALEADERYAPLLLAMLQQHAASPAIVIRTAFVLGNLTTASNAYRDQVAEQPGVPEQLASLLASYALQNSELQRSRGGKVSKLQLVDCSPAQVLFH